MKTINTANCLGTYRIGHGLKFVLVVFESIKTQILLVLQMLELMKLLFTE